MKRLLLWPNAFMLGFVLVNCWAQENAPNAAPVTLPSPLAALRVEVQSQAKSAPAGGVSVPLFVKAETGTVPAQRSVKKAFIFSALLPGAGELYNHSYLTALAFAGVEVGAWMLHTKYDNRGNDLTDTFELYADTHWSEARYWDSLARDSGGKCSASDRACLKDYERTSFSHFLPDSKNQTYYENIGKYDQFNAGWDDSKSGDARQRDSVNREAYTYMRLDANKQFKKATRATTVILVNHLLSALHAAYSTHRHNQQIKTSVGMRLEQYESGALPTMQLSVAW